jgi:hypothetical protein
MCRATILAHMDNVALAALVLSTGFSLLAVPDVHPGDLIEPTVQAAITTPIVLTVLLAFRLGGKPPVWERRLMAFFLAVMPTVYLTSMAVHGGDRTWLAIELAGQLAFAALALAGLRGSGWFLVAGIAAHGLLWDAWHLGRTSFMPDWYAIACLIVDVGWAAYAASRVAVWEAARATPRARAAYAPSPAA